MNRSGLIYTIIFSFIASFVFVLLLAAANEGTREQVAYNLELARQKAILNAMKIPYENDDEVDSLYQNIEVTIIDDKDLYYFKQADRTIVAEVFQGAGLWGTIQGVLAIQEDFDQIVGMEIISHNETPGLGGRITEAWFLDQFSGEQIGENLLLVDTQNKGPGDYDPANQKVDGITGATRTSKSMETIVNNEIEKLKELLGEQ